MLSPTPYLECPLADITVQVGNLFYWEYEGLSFSWNAFGGSQLSVTLILDYNDPHPLEGEHVSIVRVMGDYKEWGGLVENVSVTQITDEGLEKVQVQCVGYDSYLREESLLTYDSVNPVTISVAAEAILQATRLYDPMYGTPALKAVVQGDTGTMLRVQPKQNISVEQAIIALCAQFGNYQWYVDIADFKRIDLLPGAIGDAVSQLYIVRKGVSATAPVPKVDYRPTVCRKLTDPHYSNPNFRVARVRPTRVKAGDSIASLQAEQALPFLDDEQLFSFKVDDQRKALGPLLPTTTRLRQVIVEPANGEPSNLTPQQTPFKPGQTFATGVDCAHEKETGLIRFRQEIGLFAPGQAGNMRALQRQERSYALAIDEPSESLNAQRSFAKNGTITSYIVNPELTDNGKAMAAAQGELNNRPPRFQSLSFSSREVGWKPLQQVTAYHEKMQVLNEITQVTSISVSPVDDPDAEQRQRGEVLEYKIDCVPVPPRTVEEIAIFMAEQNAAIEQPRELAIDPPPAPTCTGPDITFNFALEDYLLAGGAELIEIFDGEVTQRFISMPANSTASITLDLTNMASKNFLYLSFPTIGLELFKTFYSLEANNNLLAARQRPVLGAGQPIYDITAYKGMSNVEIKITALQQFDGLSTFSTIGSCEYICPQPYGVAVSASSPLSGYGYQPGSARATTGVSATDVPDPNASATASFEIDLTHPLLQVSAISLEIIGNISASTTTPHSSTNLSLAVEFAGQQQLNLSHSTAMGVDGTYSQMQAVTIDLMPYLGQVVSLQYTDMRAELGDDGTGRHRDEATAEVVSAIVSCTFA